MTAGSHEQREGKCQERADFKEVVIVSVVTLMKIRKIMIRKMMTVCVPLCLKRPKDCHVPVPTYSWQEGKPMTGGG